MNNYLIPLVKNIIKFSECRNDPRSVSMHWPCTFVIVRLQSQCFDALLIFKRMLISENWLKQDIRMLQFIHAPNLWYVLCTNNSIRSWQILYVNHVLRYVNGNADNQNLLISVTHWVERTDFDQVGSLVLFNQNMPKSTTGFSHAPLETAFTHHRRNTASEMIHQKTWPLVQAVMIHQKSWLLGGGAYFPYISI